MPDGTGEAKRAVETLREADPAAGDLLPDAREGRASGTGLGREGEEGPLSAIVLIRKPNSYTANSSSNQELAVGSRKLRTNVYLEP